MDEPFIAKEVLERGPDFAGRASQVRLRSYEWDFLLALDGRRTVAQAAQVLGLDADLLPDLVAVLRAHELVTTPQMSWEEYAQRGSAPAAAAAGPARPALAPDPGPEPERERELAHHLESSAAPLVAEAAPPSRVAFAIRRPAASGTPGAAPAAVPVPPAPPVPATPRVPAPPAAPARRPEPAPSATTRPVSVSALPTANGRGHAPAVSTPAREGPRGGLKLRGVMDYVAAINGGGMRGKLAVYRLFLRVPNEQIRAAGIESLNFVDANLVITEPTVRRAIVNAVEEVTGMPLPAELAT